MSERDAGLDLAPVPAAERRARLPDVALVFAGANIVTTTLVTGGTLGPAFSLRTALLLVLAGTVAGNLILASLARLGPRFGLPTMVLLRRPFGDHGSQAVSLLLVLTNFAWIALNNLIAAGALSRLAGGPEWLWVIAVGAVATVVALFGPRAMALFNRFAVPLLVLVGVALTWALVAAPERAAVAGAGNGSMSWLAGLDVVIGYQISWSLMFADYTRYQKRASHASLAVFLGMSLSSLWLMSLGAAAAKTGGGNDPTAMILGAGLPLAALLLMALSTITTNFVNLYLSALALRNLHPAAPPRATVIAVGTVGALIGIASPALLDRYAGFMGWIGTSFLPIVAIVGVCFFSGRRGADPPRRWEPRALVAWLVGVATYQATTRWLPQLGATLPTLLVTAAVYASLRLQATTPRPRESRTR